MPVFNNALAGAAGSGGAADYIIERSLRFNSDDQTSLEKTIPATTTFSFSFWYKHVKLTRSDILVTDASHGFFFYQHTDGSFRVNNNNTNLFTSNGQYRDPTAWYHLLLTNDGTTFKLYVNGVLDKAQTVGTLLNAGGIYIGRDRASANNYGDFYMADAHFIDGQALAPTNFGEFDATTGVWNPIEYTNSTTTSLPITAAPTLSNGALIIKAVGNGSLSGIATSQGGNLNFWTSSDGSSWSHSGTGQGPNTIGASSVKYVAMAGAGTSNRTWESTGPDYEYALWNTDTSFDSNTGTPGDVTSLTYTAAPSSNYGTNGFHLDFDPTAGQVYSSGTLTGSIHSGNPLTRAFDGNLNTGTWAGSSSGFELTFPSAETVANSITVVGGSSQSNYKVIVGGNEYTITFPNGSSSYTQEVTVNVSGSFTGIKATSNHGELRGIKVDGGPLLIDHEPPGVDASGSRNHWTPNNLTPKGGVTITSAKVYSSYNGATVSANYSVQYSDDNSNWTTAFSGVMSNNGACGIQTGTNPGDGSYGAHKYWKLLVGSTVTTHWPRSSRILLSDGTNDYAVRTFTSDNCSDSGGIPQDGDSYTYTSSINPADLDVLIDSPTNYDDGTNIGGNFATLNPLSPSTNAGTYTNGNLDFTRGSGYGTAKSTIGMTSGKWYCEVTRGSGNTVLGILDQTITPDYLDRGSGGYGYRYDGTKVHNNQGHGNIGGYNSTDIVGLAFDADAKVIYFYKNGNLQGSFTNVTTAVTESAWFFAFSAESTTISVNFGQRPFLHLPSGYKALCTQNLTDPEILDGSEHFTPLLYTGSGGLRRVGGPVYSSTSTLSSATNAFNGNTSNGGVFNSTGNTVLTAGSITIESSLEIYHNRTGSDGITVNINGTDYTATGLSSTGYHTIPIPSSALPLTTTGNITIKDNQSGGSSTCYAVRVDGIIVGDGTGVLTKFKPDLAWLKSRGTNRDHFWHDSVRGSTKALYSNNSNVEYDYGTSGVTKFHDDGLTVNGAYAANYTNETYVAWLWNGGDLATNSAYDQDKVWSSFWSATGNGIEAANPAANSFDGVLTGLGMRLNGSSSCTWAPTGGYSYSGDFLIYACKDNNYTGVSWTVVHAGGTTDITSSVASGTTMTELNLTNLGVQSPITSISFTSNSSSNPRIAGMKANGKILVDAGVVPVGSLNSTVYNTSQNWSVSGSNMQNNWSASFDGDTDPHFALPNTGYSASMTFPSAISYQTLELVVARDIYAPDLLMNGNALNVPATDTNTTSGRYKIERLYFTNGTLTSIGHETRNTAGRGGSGFWQIIVDGKILVDANQASNAPDVPSIATTCTSNPTAGFAISTYTGNSTDGASIAHNLGSTPEMVIIKPRNKDDDWRVYHVGAGNPYYLRLQLTNNKTGTNNWREMSLNYFALDADSAVNSSSYNYVAYSFSSVPGYSAIGSYEANSNSDGPYVFTGFRPAFLMVKNIDDTQHSSAYNWTIVDTSRYPFNETSDLNALYANSTANEDTYTYGGASTGLNIDILSNGFKLRSASAESNHGNTYIYYAVAENPFKLARAR